MRMLYSRQRSAPSSHSGDTVYASTLPRCRSRRGVQAGHSCCSAYWDTDWPGGLGRHRGSRTSSAHTHTDNTDSRFTFLYSSVCISCTYYCVVSGTDFGLRAALGEMSMLVAVSTLDTLGGVVSVWQTLNHYPGTLVFVIDLSLKHIHSKCIIKIMIMKLKWVFCTPRKITINC